MNFEAIENRCREHIRDEANRQAKAMIDDVARKVGFNPDGWLGMDDEFKRCSQQLLAYLQGRIRQQLESKLLSAAQDAA